MEEKEGFVENSNIAIKGIANGIFGSILYELILSLFVSVIVTMAITAKNPGAGEQELTNLINGAFNSFPFDILISCVGGIITLAVFAIIIRFDKFTDVLKKSINIKTLKYGIICAICIMLFSILYNTSIVSIFNLDSSGNSNQEGVIELIKSGPILGFLSVVVLAPIVEEFTYRYCLFGLVIKEKKWLGYAASGIVFMLMHSISSFLTVGFTKELLVELLYLPPYLFSGLALCYVYDKSNNLGSSIIAHVINNLISFLGIVSMFIIFGL